MSDTQNQPTAQRDLVAIYQALDKIQAIIEFELDGTIISANSNFLSTTGYQLEEIAGKHHRIFCDPAYAESTDYKAFWQKLSRGENDVAQIKRFGKDGREIWLQASYNPVLDNDGNPVRVIKFASDITETVIQQAEYQGKLQAINKSQAVVEFDLDGNIITGNENFLSIFGYTLDEVAGKHHRIFCDLGYAESHEYKQFWQRLKRGEFETGEYKRVGKDGAEIWLQASYNPILDADGKPWRVIKFAADITSEVQRKSLAMLEMSTLVTKIWDGVLFAPIVGILDSKRSLDIMNKALSSIAETRSNTLLLDIGGVAVVDTAVANHLIKIAKAAVLMGCNTIISGISPAIAQTIVELGVDLGSIKTTSTIESALREAIQHQETH